MNLLLVDKKKKKLCLSAEANELRLTSFSLFRFSALLYTRCGRNIDKWPLRLLAEKYRLNIGRSIRAMKTPAVSD